MDWKANFGEDFPQKSKTERSSRASRPSVSKKCRKGPKESQRDVKTSVRILFRHFFLTLRAGRPGKTFLFETFWGKSEKISATSFQISLLFIRRRCSAEGRSCCLAMELWGVYPPLFYYYVLNSQKVCSVTVMLHERGPRNSRWRDFDAHQNRTIAIASNFRVDGAKSPEIRQKERVPSSEIATRNRKSLATLHHTLKSQCKVSQSQIAIIAAILVRQVFENLAVKNVVDIWWQMFCQLSDEK